MAEQGIDILLKECTIIKEYHKTKRINIDGRTEQRATTSF